MERDEREALAESRTDLAEDRTVLANERTFAGWVRTGLATVGIGLGLDFRMRGGCAAPVPTRSVADAALPRLAAVIIFLGRIAAHQRKAQGTEGAARHHRRQRTKQGALDAVAMTPAHSPADRRADNLADHILLSITGAQ